MTALLDVLTTAAVLPLWLTSAAGCACWTTAHALTGGLHPVVPA